MKRITLIIVILLVSSILIGCGGNNMDNNIEDKWIDTLGEGYPSVDDDEFVPVFIRENQKKLDRLAEMMLLYNFDYDIYFEEDICVMIRKDNASQEEKDRLIDNIKENEELMKSLVTLFEFKYIRALVYNDADGKSVSIVFLDIENSLGPISRGARYIPESVLRDHPRKEEYISKYHVVGNWFYMAQGRV